MLSGVDAVLVNSRAPADASICLVPDLPAGIGLLAVEAGIAKIAAGAGPHLFRNRLCQRLVDCLNRADTGPDGEDRRWIGRVEQVAFRRDHLERPELPAVRWLVRRGQALEADARCRAGHAEAEIDGPVDLLA